MSLGGRQKTTDTVDPVLRDIALQNLGAARQVGQLGFVPYKGATVAGLSDAQLAAMQNTNAGLSAFGLSGSPVPAAGDLSPYEIYQQQLASMAPGQRAFIESMFINPMTGAAPTMQMGGVPAAATPTTPARSRSGGGGVGPTANRGGSLAASALAARLPGGVNTNNPNSLVNRLAAAAMPRQGVPTAANRPKARPTR